MQVKQVYPRLSTSHVSWSHEQDSQVHFLSVRRLLLQGWQNWPNNQSHSTPPMHDAQCSAQEWKQEAFYKYTTLTSRTIRSQDKTLSVKIESTSFSVPGKEMVWCFWKNLLANPWPSVLSHNNKECLRERNNVEYICVLLEAQKDIKVGMVISALVFLLPYPFAPFFTISEFHTTVGTSAPIISRT